MGEVLPMHAAKFEFDQHFLSFVLFADVAGFTRDGIFYSHNTNLWTEKNPHGFSQSTHQKFNLNVWAGFLGDRFTGF